MKRTVTILSLLIIFSQQILSQTERVSLAEQFTSSTCGPCGSINPGFDALLHANTDKITSIKYHMSWPAPGNDPMYLHNTIDNNARKTYYNVNSVPHVQIDGTYWSGNPGNVSQGLINSASGQPSPFNMQAHHELNEDGTEIHVSILIESEEAVNEGLTLHNVVIEKHIHFSSPPGTNGETDFYNVMKKMLPSASGSSLPAFEAGDYIIVEGSWALANVYDNNQLAAVGFIQNNLSKEIFMAALSSEGQLTPLYTLDANVVGATNMTDDNCTGKLTPIITIRNNGSDNLTSATIKYHVNGGELYTYGWMGNLGAFEKSVIELPEFSFGLQDENLLVVYIEEPNGETDDYQKNDTLKVPFNKAYVTDDVATLTMKLDNFPEQTSWEITNSMNEVVYSGGNYTQSGQFIQEDFTFDAEDCYTFYLYDSEGDGFGTTGFVNFHIGPDVVLQATGNFGAMAYNQFEYASFVGIDNEMSLPVIDIYPNPANQMVNINVNYGKFERITVDIIDITGRIIKSGSYLNNTGTNTMEFGLTGVGKGLYFVKVSTGGSGSYSKFIVE